MRTISISALSRTMSNKPGFGRDASEFLRSIGESCQREDYTSGIGITAIVPCADRCFEVRIEVNGGGECERYEFLLLAELSERLELSIGAIEGELMPEIEYFSEVTKAYFSACSSFAYAPSSLKGLERKLIQKGLGADVAREAIEFISSRNIVDEADVAVRRLELMVKKLWGRTRITLKLREEGFGAEALVAAEEFLKAVDFATNCALLIEKKFGCVPRDRDEREKMISSLSRYGYSLSEIKKAISLLKN